MTQTKPGDKVTHARFGVGIVASVDRATYSVVMVVADFPAGRIVRPESELTRWK